MVTNYNNQLEIYCYILKLYQARLPIARPLAHCIIFRFSTYSFDN